MDFFAWTDQGQAMYAFHRSRSLRPGAAARKLLAEELARKIQNIH